MKRVVRCLLVAVCAGFGLLLSGCGGVNASGSVSPASFFLPGLIQDSPEAVSPVDEQQLRNQVHT